MAYPPPRRCSLTKVFQAELGELARCASRPDVTPALPVRKIPPPHVNSLMGRVGLPVPLVVEEEGRGGRWRSSSKDTPT